LNKHDITAFSIPHS